MRKVILTVLMISNILCYGQVKSIVFESKDGDACYNDMKNATVHVLIKDNRVIECYGDF